MTIKLYDENAYETRFSAQVLRCEEVRTEHELRYGIVLDQTLFFPEEGGQSPDVGVLTPLDTKASKPSTSVTDVQIKGDEIIHYCSIPLAVGDQVTGQIDRAHRFDNMQQHTGEHIFSGLVHKYHGYTNVGFHLSNETVTMDYDGELSAEQIARLEDLANQAIWENHTVTAWYPAPDELAKLDYRSKIDLTEGVRLVRIEGIDLCACCAPHVRSTAEVGLLKVVDFRRYKGGMRLWIVCGGRALADYRTLHEQSLALSGALSAPREDLTLPVEALARERDELKYKLSEAQGALMAAKVSAVPEDKKSVVLFEENITDDKVIREAANALAENRSGYCVIFYAPDEPAMSWRYICASAGSDCRAWNDKLKETFPVRGGGKEGMVQGSVESDADSLCSWMDDHR